MDDLTRIKGVGPSTARALAAAGIDGFAALAAADPAALAVSPALRGLRASPADLTAWVAEAAQLDASRAGAGEAPDAPAAGPVPAATPSGAPAVKAAPSGLVVFVRGPRRGRWRIGRFFGPEGVEISLDALDEDEKARLIADTALTIETRPAT